MKTLILSVSCINQHVDERPQSFYIGIDHRLSKRITQLSGLIKYASAYSVDAFENSGTWSSLLLDELTANEVHFDEKEALLAIEKNENRVEIATLVVRDNDFYFTSVPKHCGDDMLLSTSRVLFSELNTDDTFVATE